jgi:hypothetical protein
MLGRPCLVAKLGFVVVLMNNNVKLSLLLLYLRLIQERFICKSEQGEPPRKTVLPQDIWLCLGQVIREVLCGD